MRRREPAEQRILLYQGTAVGNEVRTVWILGRKWKVTFVDGSVLSERMGSVDGMCASDTQEINITNQQSRDWQRLTLIHEVRHAIDFTHSRGCVSDDEANVRASELGWYNILRDPRNDWFVEFIREGREDGIG